LDYLFVVDSMGLFSTTLTKLATDTEIGEITQNNGHQADRSHSRLPTLVRRESPYATSY